MFASIKSMTRIRGQLGFRSMVTLPILVIIGAIGSTGWYTWHSKNNGDRIQVPIVKNGIATFSGVVKSDNCAQQLRGGGPGNPPVGDVGCNITVNEEDVSIVHGNAYFPTWGKIEGFTADQDITGRRVTVKAHKSGATYLISGSDDYVKLLN